MTAATLPRRARTAHRLASTRTRAWCVHCGYMHDVHTGATGAALLAPHNASRLTACRGSGVAIVPDEDALAHWSLHADGCRTAEGLHCVCPLGTKGPDRDR